MDMYYIAVLIAFQMIFTRLLIVISFICQLLANKDVLNDQKAEFKDHWHRIPKNRKLLNKISLLLDLGHQKLQVTLMNANQIHLDNPLLLWVFDMIRKFIFIFEDMGILFLHLEYFYNHYETDTNVNNSDVGKISIMSNMF